MRRWLQGLTAVIVGGVLIWYGIDQKVLGTYIVGLAVVFIGLCAMAWVMLLGAVRALGKAVRGE